MENPQISVLVAVYKAEAYLHRCMDSLLLQTFRDFEIVLVDDGSPDLSGKIGDEYAAMDARIRVFHKEHGGVSSAKQCGLDHAKGAYITFVDPDDWVEPTMLEGLYAKAQAEDADLVFGDFSMEYERKSVYAKQEPSALTVKAILADLLLYGRVWSSLCGRLVRSSCYHNGPVTFPLDLTYGEDDYVLIKLSCRMNKVAYIPRAYYHYDRYINPHSLTKARTRITDARMIICEYCKADLCGVAPWIYHTHFSNIAYDYFKLNLLTTVGFREKFSGDFYIFLRSRASIKIKFFVLLSAIGYKEVAYKLYRSLKKPYLVFKNLFKWGSEKC